MVSIDDILIAQETGKGLLENQHFILVHDSLTVLPVGRDAFGSFVVPRDAMDPTLNENKSEFSVLVLTVTIQMFTN